MAVSVKNTQEIACGDIVRLVERYQKEYQFGIVVEILNSTHLSLHLYNEDGQLYQLHQKIPTYVDFHISEVLLFKKAKEIGYKEATA